MMSSLARVTALFAILKHAQCTATRQPNIIFIIADDQDVLLDSMQAMPKTLEYLADEGITMQNAFSASPVCCASRTETLAGRTFHNIEAQSGQVSCQHAAADHNMFENENALFQKFHSNGYITGAFGKVVNKVSGYWCAAPTSGDGFDRIHLSCDYEDFYGTKYYNRYVDGSSDTVDHTLDENVYQTAMMGNATVDFVHERMLDQTENPDTAQPFIMWVGPYAPHTAATPAAWYADEYETLELYETPNFNQVCPNHHAPVGNNAVLGDEAQRNMVQLHKDRLRSLMSVDDMVGAIVEALEEYGEVGENTYVVYTSDHGYSLGQFAIPCGKMQPYEQTTRIPLYIRGPGIDGGSTSDKLVGNIDFLPTFLDFAGISYDTNDYDGRSMRSILESGEDYSDDWRSAYLMEFKSVGTFGITHCPTWWPSADGSVVPGQIVRPSSGSTNNQLDNVDTNNWRVLRFIDETGNKYYGEFYNSAGNALANVIDYEYFDLSTDPWQMTNAYDSLSDTEKSEYSSLLQQYGACSGADACSPITDYRTWINATIAGTEWVDDAAPRNQWVTGALLLPLAVMCMFVF